MNSKRDEFFDVVKGFAMFFVVLGHVSGIASGKNLPMWVDNFRVGFNMPVFFALSGYFSWPLIENTDWRKLIKTLRSYFQPTIFFSVVFTLASLMAGFCNPTLLGIFRKLFFGVFVDPWFITTLAECLCILFLAWAVGKSAGRTCLVVAIIMALIVCRPSWVPGKIHFACVLNMLPCYMFGAIILRGRGWRAWESGMVGFSCFAAAILFAVLEGNVKCNGMSFYTAESTLIAFNSARGAIAFFVRPLVGIVATIGIMFILRIAMDCKYVRILCRPFISLGTVTLGVYLFHLWPIERLRAYTFLADGCFVTLSTTVAALLVSYIVVRILSLGCLKKLIWGKA